MEHQEPDLPGFAEVKRAVRIMQDFPRLWCVCGGWAIDLFVQRITRQHKDVDFAIRRRDQLALRAYLSTRGWTLDKAFDGELVPWAEGEHIDLPVHTIWCRNPNSQPDFIEILFNEADEQKFFFRRDRSITRPLTAAIIQLESGIRILAPEIVLLYKAKHLWHEGNRSDFETALPCLDSERRAWLREALLEVHPGHDWLSRL